MSLPASQLYLSLFSLWPVSSAQNRYTGKHAALSFSCNQEEDLLLSINLQKLKLLIRGLCCIFRCLIAVKGNFSERKYSDSSRSTTHMQAFYPATDTKCNADNNKVLGSPQNLSLQEPVIFTSAEDSQQIQSPLCTQAGFRGEKRLGFLLVLSEHRLWCEPGKLLVTNSAFIFAYTECLRYKVYLDKEHQSTGKVRSSILKLLGFQGTCCKGKG